MPQISHTNSVVLAHVGVNGTDTIEIPEARNYTKFIIDATHAGVTAVSLEVNVGNGWHSLYVSSMGAAQEVTLNKDGINVVELLAPAKGGVRLSITDNAEDAAIPVYVTMTGSLYTEGRNR